MSKLEELIAELCPDGVEYKKLGDVSTITRGGNFQKRDYVESGIPCIHYGQIYTQYGLFVSETISFISEEKAKKQKMANTDDIIMAVTSENIDDVCKCVAWLGEGEIAVSGHTAIIQHSLNPKYLVYYFHSMMFYKQKAKLAHGTKVIEVTPSKLINIIIPVPPLSVQSEIVRILDNFTELTTELTMELTTELTARKKQYEYYLDNFYGHDYEGMLKMADNQSVKILPLSEVGTLTRGKRFVKADSEGLTSGVPCLHYGELYTYYGVSAEKPKSFVKPELATKLRFATKGDIVIVGAGENNIDIGIGVAWFGDENIAVHDACYTFTHNQNPKYISYYLRTNIYHNQIKKDVSEGKICSISASGLGKALIPIPSIEEQNRIVSILERFDNLCNDISNVLPAEIVARKKQYEYYREKLLTFKDIS